MQRLLHHNCSDDATAQKKAGSLQTRLFLIALNLRDLAKRTWLRELCYKSLV
ncbi:MAG: hypothetical protein ACJAWF_004082, partial [Candidatus Azotimanducaceae bacterium]